MVCAAQIQGGYVACSLKLPQDLIHIWQRIRITLRGGIHFSHVDHHTMFITSLRHHEDGARPRTGRGFDQSGCKHLSYLSMHFFFQFSRNRKLLLPDWSSVANVDLMLGPVCASERLLGVMLYSKELVNADVPLPLCWLNQLKKLSSYR